ncbi:hypothetical protein GCM10027591_00170 [Zhihengliuella somnathii]
MGKDPGFSPDASPAARARHYAQIRQYEAYADDPQALLASVASLEQQARDSRREAARLNHELAAARRDLAAAAARRDRLDELYRKQTKRAERFKNAHAQLLRNPAIRLIQLTGKAGSALRRAASTSVGRGLRRAQPNGGDAAEKREVVSRPEPSPSGTGPVLPELPPLGSHPAYQPVPDRILVVRDPSHRGTPPGELTGALTGELIGETLDDTTRRLEWLGADVVVHHAQPVGGDRATGWQVVADELGRALMKHRPATVHLAVTDPDVRAAAQVAARRFNVPVLTDPAVAPTAPVGLETRRYFPQRRDRDLVRAVRSHVRLEPNDAVVLIPAPEEPASAAAVARRVFAGAGGPAGVKVVFFHEEQAGAEAVIQELAAAGMREHAVALPRSGAEGAGRCSLDRLLTLADFLVWDAPAGAIEGQVTPDAVRVRAEAMDVLTLDSDRLGELKRWVSNPGARADEARRRRRRVAAQHKLADRAEQLRAQHRSLAAGSSAGELAALGDLRIGCIADEFTTAAFEGEVAITALTPENWAGALTDESIDALIVESAWAGNGGAWTRGIGHYSDAESQPLRQLLAACRERAIPTIFWNKEDPVHTDRFIDNARLFDVVATTDAECLPSYLEQVWAGTQVVSAPFFAQPRLHHPLTSESPHEAPLANGAGGAAAPDLVAYAGTFYGARYPERSAELEMLLDAAGEELAIYDRQLTVPESPYEFPGRLATVVRAGLTYRDTLEAYRSHPIHLNVNSVTDSPTMFSRRVVEIGACATPVISGRGRAVADLFGELVPQPSRREEARELIDYWRDHPAARRRDGWRLARSVHRSHLAGHRLVMMLRTAGLAVDGTSLPAYQLDLEHLTEDVARHVVAQTHRPARVVWRDGAAQTATAQTATAKAGTAKAGTESAVRLLIQAGVELSPDPDPSPALALLSGSQAGVADYLRVPTFAEDFARLLRVGQLVTPGQAPVAAALTNEEGDVAGTEPADHTDQGGARPCIRTVGRDAPEAFFGTRPAAGDRVVEAPWELLRGDAAPVVRLRTEEPTLLIAGHDLKFADSILDDLREAGWRILTDEWADHNEHDADQSESLLSQADVVWCEWALGNTAWYARHVEPHQRLLVRFHSQELFTPYLRDVDLTRVDRWIFVGEHLRDAACLTYGLDRTSTTVIPNAVDPMLFDLPKSPEARFTLGLVGIVPSQKHVDRALDLLEILRAQDDRFRLVIKGRLPEEYPWIMRQEDQRQYFERQFERCRTAPLLAGAVDLESFGTDMTDFYRRIGVALSTSDFESFHLTLADGAASGAVPMSLAWPGVEDIYPGEWAYDDVAAMAADLLAVADRPQEFAERGAAARDAARGFSRSAVVHSLMRELHSE